MCHLCLTRAAQDTVKCKLCCDGLEQDMCLECAQMYDKYRRTLDGNVFALLQARRSDGIAVEKAARAECKCTDCLIARRKDVKRV